MLAHPTDARPIAGHAALSLPYSLTPTNHLCDIQHIRSYDFYVADEA